MVSRPRNHCLNWTVTSAPTAEEKGQAESSCAVPQAAQELGQDEARVCVPYDQLGDDGPNGYLSNYTSGGGADSAGGPGVQITVLPLRQCHQHLCGGPPKDTKTGVKVSFQHYTDREKRNFLRERGIWSRCEV